VNKFSLLYFFSGIIFTYSSELTEYCFSKDFENDKCLYLQMQNIPPITKVKQADSLECDGEFDLERQDTFNLNKNTVANYKTYDTQGCSGTGIIINCSLDGTEGSFEELSTTKCPVRVKLDIPPVTFPNKFSICEYSSFQIKDVFGKIFRVEWKSEIKCPPHNDTTLTGSYFIRITGECPKGN